MTEESAVPPVRGGTQRYFSGKISGGRGRVTLQSGAPGSHTPSPVSAVLADMSVLKEGVLHDSWLQVTASWEARVSFLP